MSGGTVTTHWHEYRWGWVPVEAEVIEETLATLCVNGIKIANITCSPFNQDWLAVGFLKNEKWIESIDEIKDVKISRGGRAIEVLLQNSIVKPEREAISQECDNEITLERSLSGLKPLTGDTFIRPDAIFDLFDKLQPSGCLYSRAGGVHAAGLADGDQMLARVEDISRRSALDKLVGGCLLNGIDTRGSILLLTGRISSEMLLKGARMGCPVIASRNSPTSMSIELAKTLNITLIGYARGESMRVYSHLERLNCAVPADVLIAGE
jgi:FdhD protein